MTELALRTNGQQDGDADGDAKGMATFDDLVAAAWTCRNSPTCEEELQREHSARALAADHLLEVWRRYERHHRVKIVESYFCKHLPGAGVILTSDGDMHLRYPPAAVAHVSPEFEGAIWRSVGLCRRANEQLSGSRQRLIAKPLHSVVVYLLGVLDAQHSQSSELLPGAAPSGNGMALRALGGGGGGRRALVAQARAARTGTDRINHAIETADQQLEAVERQLVHSALQQARQHYLVAMLVGVVLLLLLALPLLVPTDEPLAEHLVLNQLGGVDTALLLGLVGFGGMGAVLSVLGRVTASVRSSDSPFVVDHEAGTTMIYLAGAFRPLVGALFAVALFVLMESKLVPLAVGDGSDGGGWYGYWGLAFIAGFSERFAQDAIGTSKLVRRGDRKPAGRAAPDGG